MGNCLISNTEKIETKLNVNEQKKKKKKSQLYKQHRLKKVPYSTGVCNLLFYTFLAFW